MLTETLARLFVCRLSKQVTRDQALDAQLVSAAMYLELPV